ACNLVNVSSVNFTTTSLAPLSYATRVTSRTSGKASVEADTNKRLPSLILTPTSTSNSAYFVSFSSSVIMYTPLLFYVINFIDNHRLFFWRNLLLLCNVIMILFQFLKFIVWKLLVT